MTNRILAALTVAGLGAAVVALVIAFELGGGSQPPTFFGVRFDPRFSEGLLLLICAAVTVGLTVRLAIGPRRLVRTGALLLALAMLASGLLYFYAQRGLARRHYGKWHDSFHYVLGAKYFKEVGYFNFYDCVATAHAENTGHRRLPTWKMRDLRTYRMMTAREAMARTDCAALFERDRWLEFRADVALFHKHKSIPRVLKDHGYNGSPVHTFFAARLANAFGLTYASVTALALIDIVALTAMLAIVCLAFGARLGFLVAILFFVNFSDRFYFIGGSMMRYVWMACLTSGLAMLKLGRHRAAGALMSAAALLNIFPLLFMLAIAVRAGWSLARRRVLARRHRHFIIAAAVTAAIGLGLGASHSEGPANYGEFLSFIGGHSQKLTSSRTGLRFTVLYRGQTTRDDKPRVSFKRKARQLRRLAPVVVAMGAALVLAGLVLCVRLDDVEACALLGVLLFYVIFGTVEYYYAVTPTLLLAFHSRLKRRVGVACVAGLFALMTGVLWAWRETQFLQFCNNTVMSAALLSMLSTTLVVLSADVGLWPRRRRRLLWAAALLAALSGPIVVWVFAWLHT